MRCVCYVCAVTSENPGLPSLASFGERAWGQRPTPARRARVPRSGAPGVQWLRVAPPSAGGVHPQLAPWSAWKRSGKWYIHTLVLLGTVAVPVPADENECRRSKQPGDSGRASRATCRRSVHRLDRSREWDPGVRAARQPLPGRLSNSRRRTNETNKQTGPANRGASRPRLFFRRKVLYCFIGTLPHFALSPALFHTPGSVVGPRGTLLTRGAGVRPLLFALVAAPSHRLPRLGCDTTTTRGFPTSRVHT